MGTVAGKTERRLSAYINDYQ